MASAAYASLTLAIAEVEHLGAVRRAKGSADLAMGGVERVVGRAATVLLSSHFERYIRSINEEAVDYLNGCGVCGATLPEKLRLVHSKRAIDKLVQVSWENRKKHLADFVESDGWMWLDDAEGRLSSEGIIHWMKSPKSKDLIRFYRYWNIDDIFGSITRKRQRRNLLELRVDELVNKRNNIAHGDFDAEVTWSDLSRYLQTVKLFCERSDRALAKALALLSKTSLPW